MKINLITIIFFISALLTSACEQERKFDPRYVDEEVYEREIRDLAKKYGDSSSSIYDDKKSYNFYLAHILPKIRHSLALDDPKECLTDIEEDHKKFDLIYFKPEVKDKIISFCSYNINDLINAGNQYAEETKNFDYNNLSAMLFYYVAYVRTTREYLDKNYNYIPSIIEQSRESFYKFKNIRNQLPNSYLTISNDTPFDQYDSADY